MPLHPLSQRHAPNTAIGRPHTASISPNKPLHQTPPPHPLPHTTFVTFSTPIPSHHVRRKRRSKATCHLPPPFPHHQCAPHSPPPPPVTRARNCGSSMQGASSVCPRRRGTAPVRFSAKPQTSNKLSQDGATQIRTSPWSPGFQVQPIRTPYLFSAKPQTSNKLFQVEPIQILQRLLSHDEAELEGTCVYYKSVVKRFCRQPAHRPRCHRSRRVCRRGAVQAAHRGARGARAHDQAGLHPFVCAFSKPFFCAVSRAV